MSEEPDNFTSSPDFLRMIALYGRVGDESERGMAVLMAAELDRVTLNLLKCFIPMGKARDYLLIGQSAPISSFSSKINLARALSLITEDEFHDLHIIRKIRNEFAHSSNVSFADISITSKISHFRKTYSNYSPRKIFEVRGVDLITEIEFDASRKAGERVREESYNTFYRRDASHDDTAFETAEAVATTHGAIVSWK